MADFSPVNNLEIALRAMLRDKNTPSWSFYTPLARARLWIFARNPELDGGGLPVPEGKNPDVCVLRDNKNSFIGIYTAECRAEKAFKKLKLSRTTFTWVSAPGHQLLQFLSPLDAILLINLGLPECEYFPDPDMIEILLSRPEPPAALPPTDKVRFNPPGNPERYLAPLKDFLGKQPTVRAAWIVSPASETDSAAGPQHYEIHLVMNDPEDKSLREKVQTMVKALTPIEMEWQVGVLMADDDSFRRLATKSPPFYRRKDFLSERA
jgi:hypothetical protein